MHKLILILVIILLLCGCVKAPALDKDTVAPSPSPTPVEETPIPTPDQGTPEPSDTGLSLTLEERMATLSFVPVSGRYARNSIQDNIEYTEMFLIDKSSFIRAALNETEEEVFAYNYENDQFTYLYYFEGELLSKVIYDIGADTVLEDEDALADLLINDAQDLKNYFFVLLDTAEIGVEELK